MSIDSVDCSIDIWATGCIIFELLSRTPLFPGDAEGLQLIEMQQVIGPPSDVELSRLQTEMKVE